MALCVIRKYRIFQHTNSTHRELTVIHFDQQCVWQRPRQTELERNMRSHSSRSTASLRSSQMKMDQNVDEQYVAEFDIVASSTMAYMPSLFHVLSEHVRESPNMCATNALCGGNIVAIVRLAWHMYQAYVAIPTA